ncbi:hypothetical protein Droror1_Dr00018865 [Drosera rotundifolia]
MSHLKSKIATTNEKTKSKSIIRNPSTSNPRDRTSGDRRDFEQSEQSAIRICQRIRFRVIAFSAIAVETHLLVEFRVFSDDVSVCVPCSVLFFDVIFIDRGWWWWW